MKKITGIFSGLIIITALLFFGCPNFMMPATGNGGQTAAGEGIVQVSFSAGRAALSPSKMNFDSYDFIFTNGSQEISYAEVDRTNSDNFTFILPTGNGYSLNVKCYTGTEGSRVLAATGESDLFSVAKSTPQIVYVFLKGELFGGTGTFTFDISYPPDAEIEELYFYTGAGGENKKALLNNYVNGAGAFNGSTEIEAGWYFLIAILKNETDNTQAGYANGVLIHPGQTTDFEYEFDESHFFNLDEIYVENHTLLIFQVGAPSDADSSISHSFIELYNTGNAAVDLTNYSVWYAAGTTLPGLQDSTWTKIDLSGASNTIIQPKHSFLIRGPRFSENIGLAVSEPDLDVPAMIISNRAFKVALMYNTESLSVENPFDVFDGNKSAGYVDMVGAVNTAGSDYINGFETAPLNGLRKHTGIRRSSMTDTDNNAVDFTAQHYGNIPPAEVLRNRPRNHADGEWYPFGNPQPEPAPIGRPHHNLAGDLLILQAYGSSDNADGASHSFVELYNNTDASIVLDGISLYYADGKNYEEGQKYGTELDWNWERLPLQGTLPGRTSFLVLGPKQSNTARLQIPDDYGDMNPHYFSLSNRAFKVALIYGNEPLTVQNPFMSSTQAKVDGYIDMVGSLNEIRPAPRATDTINGFETLCARNSGSEAIRRIVKGSSGAWNFTDTDNNRLDFNGIRYAQPDDHDPGDDREEHFIDVIQIPEQAREEMFEYYRPKNMKTDGSWIPGEPPVVTGPPPDYSKLLITEVSGEHKYVEIFNSGTESVLLSSVKLQRNDGASEWVGNTGDVIPAGAYRLFLFNSFTAGLDDNPAYTGWTVGSGISDQQILKVALLDPAGNEISVFIRGELPLPAWQDTTGVERNRAQSYSRMSDGSWAYANPTPGAANGVKISDIVSPGYLTSQVYVNEVCGNNKFVELFKSSAHAVSLNGMRLQRNEGPPSGSEWLAKTDDVIPAGAYRLILFNGYSAGLNNNPAYTGWTVSSGISSGQILKVALLDPVGNEISVFIRGDLPLPPWQNTAGVVQNSSNSYSRMSDGTWAYASPTPGAINGTMTGNIVNPGYLTSQFGGGDPPVIPDGSSLMIFQVGAATDGNISHSFVELYNNGDVPVSLSGYSLQYAAGLGTPGLIGATTTQDGPWSMITLTGTIPVKTSFLILGSEGIGQTGAAALKLTPGSGDINQAFVISNRAFKVALMSNTTLLDVQNPFNIDGAGTKDAGYVDMVGAINTAGTDYIQGFETAAITDLNKQAGQRRTSLIDTDNNKTDFARAVYDGALPEDIEIRRPKNLNYGAWDPFGEPIEPQDYSKLKLNEVSGVGDDPDKFYELINIGTKDINLAGCKIYYNANSATGQPLPSGKGSLTWTGSSSQIITAGQLFSLIGRNTPGSFTTGLTAQRTLIITLEDPQGNMIDQCIRADDTGEYDLGNSKSFSRIPDGSGPFYFTNPTPKVLNGSFAEDLTLVPYEVNFPAISSLVIGGQTAVLGTPAASYNTVAMPGSVNLSDLISITSLEITSASEGITFRTAKVTGSGAPSWSSVTAYSFANNDTLYIEADNGKYTMVYKINITLVPAGTTVTVSGNYTLNLQSGFNQQGVVIEACNSADGTTLLGSTQASIAVNGKTGSGTWSMQVPSGTPLWLKVKVTDTTGWTFGKIILGNQTYNSNASNVNLTLAYTAQPKLENFTLLKSWARNLQITNKTAPGFQISSTGNFGRTENTINESTGEIVFGNLGHSFSPDIFINFHKLAADFELPPGCDLYVGNVKQVPQCRWDVVMDENGDPITPVQRELHSPNYCGGLTYETCTCTPTTNNYFNKVVFTVRTEDNAQKTYFVDGAKRDPVTNTPVSVAGTNNWQTQGFGVIFLNTDPNGPKDFQGGILGLNDDYSGKINVMWNDAVSYTYIGPTGRVLEGRTSVKYRGNATYRDVDGGERSISVKLGTAAGFDYYDYTIMDYRILPAHTRWSLLTNHAVGGHGGSGERIKDALTFEMGRHVLTNTGWHPHADWVFLYQDGEYKGLYNLVEEKKIDPGRLDIGPEMSKSNPNGGYILHIDNTNWYRTWPGDYGIWVFKDLYSFMTSHQSPILKTTEDLSPTVLQGHLFTLVSPDSNLWNIPDPPDPIGAKRGNLTPSDTSYFPFRAHVLLPDLVDGSTDYNRPSKPVANWRVPDETGPSRMGTGYDQGGGGFLRVGTFDQNDGGVNGTRTLSQAYPGNENTPFVKAAKFVQDAEDTIYAHDYGVNGVGGYNDYIDIDSFIDNQICWDLILLRAAISMNGVYMYFDPNAGYADPARGVTKGRLKMGLFWDVTPYWDNFDVGINIVNDGYGHVRKSPMWYKEFLGWEQTRATELLNGQTRPLPGVNNRDRLDPYYANRLYTRFLEVENKLKNDLVPFINLTDARFEKLRLFSNNSSNSIPQPIGFYSEKGDGVNPLTGGRGDYGRLKLANFLSEQVDIMRGVYGGYKTWADGGAEPPIGLP